MELGTLRHSRIRHQSRQGYLSHRNPGAGSDGPGTVYDPPCSQGPGAKLYTYTLYALSGSPTFSVPASQVTGQMVTDAISGLTLGSANLNLSYTRATNPTGSNTNCLYIRNSTTASKSGTATVSCDGTYAYVGSIGITTQPMMNGITSTNLQVPTPQNFQGAYGWKIPLEPGDCYRADGGCGRSHRRRDQWRADFQSVHARGQRLRHRWRHQGPRAVGHLQWPCRTGGRLSLPRRPHMPDGRPALKLLGHTSPRLGARRFWHFRLSRRRRHNAQYAITAAAAIPRPCRMRPPATAITSPTHIRTS